MKKVQAGVWLDDLSLLVDGTLDQRIMFFHRTMCQPGDYVVVLTARDLALAVGWPDVDSVRRVRTRLTQQGRLKKIKKQVQEGVWIYGWQYDPDCSPRVPQESLDILNRISPRYRWCNPGEAGREHTRMLIDTMPDFPVVTYFTDRPELQWQVVLSDLLDFSQPETMGFWKDKAPSALSKTEALMPYTVDQRLLIAMACLEGGLGRNTKHNAGWQPHSAVGWALHHMRKSVMREQTWSMSRAQIQDLLAWDGDAVSLRDYATRALRPVLVQDARDA